MIDPALQQVAGMLAMAIVALVTIALADLAS